MPIYEYHCKDCDHKFKRMMKITATEIPNCPECGSSNVVKMISLSSFILKGTGWYKTDYANKGSSSGNGSGTTNHTKKEYKYNNKSEKSTQSSANAGDSGSPS